VKKLALALLLLPLQALAQTGQPGQTGQPVPRSVGLRDTLAIAVKQNRALRAVDAEIEIARANELAALGNEDLLLDAEASYLGRRTSPVATRTFQVLQQDTFHLEVGATKPLWFGGRLGLRAEHDYDRQQNRLQVEELGTVDTSSDTFNPALQLTYFMPILRGFGQDQMRAQRRRTAASTDIAVLERENLVANVVQDVIFAYWELAYAAQEVEIRRSSLELAREQLRITQARVDVGVGSPTDVAAVRQGIATRESEMLIAELAVSERALELRQISGMEITPTEIDLVAADPLQPSIAAVNVEESLTAAYERNPQIATVRARGKAATIEVEVAENGLLPQLDLNASFGPSGSAESLSGALEQLGTFKDYRVFVGLTFSQPVGRHAARGARAAAVGQLRRVQVTEEDLRAQIAVAVARAVYLVRSTEKRMQADAEAVQLGQVNLDAERARFEVGRTTNFEVLRRQDELAQSRLRQTRAAADYMKAIAGLGTLTGDLLPQYDITVKPAP
jgi:outer membrane protein TolC